jgi:predicted lysophospholipase L1 biosynthesis ABC-type transport system permease subunit
MTGRTEELFVGALCVVLALLLVLRLGRALRTGEVPLYRTRLKRSDAGEARFWTVMAINAAVFVLLFVIAADLLLGLGFRTGG